MIHKKSNQKIAAALLALILAAQLTGCSSFKKNPTIDASSSKAQITSSKASPVLIDPSDSMSSSGAAKASPASSSAAATSSPSKDNSRRTSSEAGKAPKKIPEAKETQTIKRLSVQQASSAASSYSARTQDAGYRSLKSDKEKTLYRLIGNSVYQVAVSKTYQNYAPAGQISIPGKLTETQIRLTITAYLDDHPQVFWIANAYSYGYRNSQTVLQLYSEMTQSECNTAVLAFNGKVQSIIQSMPTGLNEFDREEYLFDYITKNCTYDDATGTGKENNWASYTAYGALISGKAVCEGYSRAMLLLGDYAGLSGVLIRGTGDGVAHMWNGIQIDGDWYHLDLTWCDSSRLVYNYFNIDDKTIRKTHVIAPVYTSLSDDQICSADSIYNLSLPVCSATKANYFKKKGIVVSTLNSADDNAIISSIAAQMKLKAQTIPFYVTAEDYDETVNRLTSAKPFKMGEYLQRAAAQAGVSLSLQNISYTTDKDDLGLNVFVSYQ